MSLWTKSLFILDSWTKSLFVHLKPHLWTIQLCKYVCTDFYSLVVTDLLCALD